MRETGSIPQGEHSRPSVPMHRRSNDRLRHVVWYLRAGVYVTLTVLVYNLLRTTYEWSHLKQPGRLVPGRMSINNQARYHIHCMGHREDGIPLVLFHNGLGASSYEWAPLQKSLANLTRSCSYDRWGRGFTPNPADNNRSTKRLLDDVFMALRRSGEFGPYIIVGHGLGAAHARSIAYKQPDLVAAIMLIDPVPGDLLLPTGEGTVRKWWESHVVQRVRYGPWMAVAGWNRILDSFGLSPFRFLFNGLPSYARKAEICLLSQWHQLRAISYEVERVEEDLAYLRHAQMLGPHLYHIPTTIVTGKVEGGPMEAIGSIWRASIDRMRNHHHITAQHLTIPTPALHIPHENATLLDREIRDLIGAVGWVRRRRDQTTPMESW